MSRAEITAPPLRSTRDHQHQQLPRRTWPVSVIVSWPRALLLRLLFFLRGKEEKRSGKAEPARRPRGRPIRLDRWRLGGIPNQTPSSHCSAGLAKPSNQAGVSVRRAEGEHGEGPRPLLLRQRCRLQVRRPRPRLAALSSIVCSGVVVVSILTARCSIDLATILLSFFLPAGQLWILRLRVELELLHAEHGQHWVQVRQAHQERRRLLLRDRREPLHAGRRGELHAVLPLQPFVGLLQEQDAAALPEVRWPHW